MRTKAFDWLASHGAAFPERTAIVDAGDGREYSYREFDERASRVAEFLDAELGLDPGARVAILSHNGAHYFETIYGCAKAECLYVALNWRLATPELEYIVADADPDVLVYGEAFAETVTDLRDSIDVDHYVAVGEPATTDDWQYDAALASVPTGEDDRVRRRMPDRDREDTWGLLYTSGTTGRPKGVPQTFDMVLYNYLNIGIPIDLTDEDTTLNVLPFFHTGGLNLYTNPTFIVGATAIVQPTFDPARTLDLLEERATVFFGVPAIYNALRRQDDFSNRDLSGVRSWSSGGAPMPASLIEFYAERDVVIRQGMGMTETGPTLFLIDEAHAVEKAGSIGQPATFVDVKIVDPDAAKSGESLDDVDAVAPGETGEMVVRGPGVAPGYWHRPEADAAAFDGDWLHTGDVARRDDDGYYYLVDRMKNMFISGGENVYPAEIEHVLHDHDDVAEAAVVAVPSEEWGEVGKAVVVTEGNGGLTAETLRTFCRERLAGYKVPRHVAFVDELPRNAAGKVERERLRAVEGGSDDGRPDGVRSDDARSDDGRPDGARSDDGRSADGQSDDAQPDDARSDDARSGNGGRQ